MLKYVCILHNNFGIVGCIGRAHTSLRKRLDHVYNVFNWSYWYLVTVILFLVWSLTGDIETGELVLKKRGPDDSTSETVPYDWFGWR